MTDLKQTHFSVPVLRPKRKEYDYAYEWWFSGSNQGYAHIHHVTRQVIYSYTKGGLIDTVMRALYSAGKRKWIPKYDLLPRTHLEIQQLLNKSELCTTFILVDSALVISRNETGGISELSTSLRDQISKFTSKERTELSENERDDQALLYYWKEVKEFRTEYF